MRSIVKGMVNSVLVETNCDCSFQSPHPLARKLRMHSGEIVPTKMVKQTPFILTRASLSTERSQRTFMHDELMPESCDET